MPLEKFELKNTGVVVHARCDQIPPLMVIAGPNGVGKSTLLEMLSRSPNGVGKSTLLEMLSRSIKGEGHSCTVRTTSHLKCAYISPHRVPVPIPFRESYPFLTRSRKYRDALSYPIFNFTAPGASIPLYLTRDTPRSRLHPDFAPYFEFKSRMAQFELELKDTLSDIYKAEKEVPRDYIPDIYQPFRDIIEYLLPGISFEEVKLQDDCYKIFFANKIGDSIEFDQLSSGEKDIIAMLFSLVEKKIEKRLARDGIEEILQEDILILIDGPETYLHPSLEISLLNYLRKSVKEAEDEGESLQFILCTHSQIIINEASPDELYLMFFPGEGIDNQLMSTKKLDREKLQSHLGNLGLTILSTGKTIIFVEGPEDVDIIRLLYPDLEYEFTLLPLGGKGRTLKIVQALQGVISELKSMSIGVFAILDMDRGKYVQMDIGELKNVVFIYPMTCIENFLLEPNEIYEALNILVKRNKLDKMSIRSGNDIKEMIDEIIKNNEFFKKELNIRIKEELIFHFNKDNLANMHWGQIETRLDEIYILKKDRLKDNIEEVKRKVRGAIDDRRLEELNGKIILGEIARGFGTSREILARCIADRMREHGRIPQVLAEIIKKVRGTSHCD